MSVRGKLDQSLDESGPGGPDSRTTGADGARDASVWAAMFHESIDTLILGTLSTSLGIVLLLVSFPGPIGRYLWIELPLTTYFALIPIGTSMGVIGIVRARLMNRFTSPLSTLGAVLCFIPAAPQILGSAGIYLLILAPFVIRFWGSSVVKRFANWLDLNDDLSDTNEEAGDPDRRDPCASRRI